MDSGSKSAALISGNWYIKIVRETSTDDLKHRLVPLFPSFLLLFKMCILPQTWKFHRGGGLKKPKNPKEI